MSNTLNAFWIVSFRIIAAGAFIGALLADDPLIGIKRLLIAILFAIWELIA